MREYVYPLLCIYCPCHQGRDNRRTREELPKSWATATPREWLQYITRPVPTSAASSFALCNKHVVGLQYWSKLRSELIELLTFLGDIERILITGFPVRAKGSIFISRNSGRIPAMNSRSRYANVRSIRILCGVFFPGYSILIFWGYWSLDCPLGDELPSLGPRPSSPVEDVFPAVPKGVFSPGRLVRGQFCKKGMRCCQGLMTTQPVWGLNSHNQGFERYPTFCYLQTSRIWRDPRVSKYKLAWNDVECERSKAWRN